MTEPDQRLADRTGLITGAASGIGAAGAGLFAAHGAALVLLDLVAQTREADRAAHPLGRFADPAEVARAALFLACAESSFTTGTSLLVDGGVTA